MRAITVAAAALLPTTLLSLLTMSGCARAATRDDLRTLAASCMSVATTLTSSLNDSSPKVRTAWLHNAIAVRDEDVSNRVTCIILRFRNYRSYQSIGTPDRLR